MTEVDTVLPNVIYDRYGKKYVLFKFYLGDTSTGNSRVDRIRPH